MGKILSAIAIIAGVFLETQAVAATQYEAETAVLSGSVAKNTNHTGYSGTGFVDGFFNSTTAQVSFTVNASSAGSYTVALHYSAGNGTSTNTGLYVNGLKIKNITCNATANWDTWADETETVTLNSGNNTIAYKTETSSGSCINLDYILVQSVTQLYSLTVSAGTGGTITVPTTSPVTVTSGVATTITATPSTGYIFGGWTVSNGSATFANSASASTTVILNSGNATIKANFNLAFYQLTVSAGTGGSITAPATSPVTVSYGVATTITATPSTGYIFGGWTVSSGSATFANSASASTTVILNSGNATIKANFNLAFYQLTVSAGTGGSITAPATSPVTVSYGVATTITASATSGYTFANWTVTSGSATFANAASASTTVTLNSGNATIQANFTPISSGSDAVTYAEITSPVNVTLNNTTVLALPFSAPSAGYITVTATGLYGTNSAYSDEQRGLESFLTLNSTSGGSLSGFTEKANIYGSAQYVNETAGFQVTAGSNIVRLIVSPRTTLTATTYKFVKCKMTVVFSPRKM